MTPEIASVQPARPLVMVATPCYGGLVGQNYMQSVIRLMQHSAHAGFDTALALLGHDSLITRSRNTLVAQFLDAKQATHLMFIDADIGFDPVQVERMLSFGEEVVAGMYPLKVIDWHPLAIARVQGGEPVTTAPMLYVGRVAEGAEAERRGAFVAGTYAGTGFLLIRRSAIERMVEAYPELRYSAIQTHPLPPNPSANQYALFDCMTEPETGTYLSEDYAFCRRWRDIGGRIWLDTEGVLTHTGSMDFTGNPRLRFPAPLAA
jgi:hypothetical protein